MQGESSLTISTNCKKCAHYFKIEKGVGLASSAQPSTFRPKVLDSPPPTSSREEPPKEHRGPPPEHRQPSPPASQETLPLIPKEAPVRDSRASEPSSQESISEASPERVAAPPPSTEQPSRYIAKKDANKYLKYTGDARDVEIICYECYEKHWIIKNASSSMCPKCGTYISLKDHEINTRWNSSIKTRGNVTIYKKGIVKNVTLHCNNLIVEGEFDAPCECAGNLIFRRETILTGRVSCKRLILERRVKIRSHSPITVQEAVIDGILVSDVVCSGTLRLTKHSKLIGTLQTKSLEMALGAKHEGAIQMG